MRSILSGIWAIVMWLISIVVMLLWGIGIVHSIKKHSNFDAVASFFPPWGIYRGAESYWHKDPSEDTDIDWNKRIKNDVVTAFVLISYSDDKKDIDDEKMQMESFSKKIAKYPAEKQQKIKEGVRYYLRYNLSVTQDEIDLFKNLKLDSSAKFNYSPTSNKLYDTINKYYPSPEIDLIKKTIDSVAFNQKLSDLPTEKIDEIIDQSKDNVEKYINVYNVGFKNIFNENYN